MDPNPIEEKKELAGPEEGKDKEASKAKMRQVLIETDGNNIHLSKNETAGKLELIAILQTLADFIKTAK